MRFPSNLKRKGKIYPGKERRKQPKYFTYNSTIDSLVYPENYKYEFPIQPKMWLDFNKDSLVLDSNGKIKEVKDFLDSSIIATQYTESDRPVYNETNNYIDFTSGTYLDLNLDFIINSDHYTLAVLSDSDSTLDVVYGAVNGNNGSDSPHIGFRGIDNYRIDYWGKNFRPATTRFNTGEFNLVSWEWINNTSKEVRCNGEIEDNTTDAGSITGVSGGGRLGDQVVGNTSLFKIKEIIFLTGSEISLDNKEKLEGYLAKKYNLTSKLPDGHTYK